jgi:elongation factor P
MASPTDIRKGKVVIWGGVPHLVTEMQHRTQGRQAGFVQVVMRNLQTGSSTNTKIRSTENVEFGFLERRKLEFSYQDGENFHFVHPETFEDTSLAKNLVEDVRLFLVENESYDVLFVDEKAIGIELPSAVTMGVVESADGVRGDTASNVQKPAKLSTGLVVQVPLFIKPGDLIRVSTEERCYLGRA